MNNIRNNILPLQRRVSAKGNRLKKRLMIQARLQTGILYRHHLLATAPLPHFLIIGAQKAGTTWLWHNLNHHPQLFLPHIPGRSDPTEVRYFDQYLHQPLRFYTKLYEDAPNSIRGDKSPNYATLNDNRIRFLRDLMPNVKIIFMLRNPIDRGWSHAVMNLVKLSHRDYSNIQDSEFQHHFQHAYARGDYCRIIERWERCFPPEQLFIDFFESIEHAPKSLLERLFAFLGANLDVNWSNFPFSQTFNRSQQIVIPPQHYASLRHLYHDDILKMQGRFGGASLKWLNAPASGR